MVLYETNDKNEEYETKLFHEQTSGRGKGGLGLGRTVHFDFCFDLSYSVPTNEDEHVDFHSSIGNTFFIFINIYSFFQLKKEVKKFFEKKKKKLV